jgi:hypothetical protein
MGLFDWLFGYKKHKRCRDSKLKPHIQHIDADLNHDYFDYGWRKCQPPHWVRTMLWHEHTSRNSFNNKVVPLVRGKHFEYYYNDVHFYRRSRNFKGSK